MEKLYFLVTRMTTWTENDPRQFLDHYFIESGAFTTSFLIALVIAICGLLLFYGWIGMSSTRLSNGATWVVTLLAVGLITLVVTQVAVIGSLDSQTGFFENATQYAQQLRGQEPNETIAEFEQLAQNIRETMDKGCNVVYALDLWNTFLAVIIFFAGSVVAKRYTRYAIAVPF